MGPPAADSVLPSREVRGFCFVFLQVRVCPTDRYGFVCLAIIISLVLLVQNLSFKVPLQQQNCAALGSFVSIICLKENADTDTTPCSQEFASILHFSLLCSYYHTSITAPEKKLSDDTNYKINMDITAPPKVKPNHLDRLLVGGCSTAQCRKSHLLHIKDEPN